MITLPLDSDYNQPVLAWLGCGWDDRRIRTAFIRFDDATEARAGLRDALNDGVIFFLGLVPIEGVEEHLAEIGNIVVLKEGFVPHSQNELMHAQTQGRLDGSTLAALCM